ncbi:uncharacterized protein [Prorops nasuta]|uniref:uncharacterized protein n=1 Tax=Prorops nasuta TaxID=863751 RepID=UPI0034CE3783
MRRILGTVLPILAVGLLLQGVSAEVAEDETSLMDCLFANNAGSCLRKKLARSIDDLEEKVTGKKTEMPISVVLEEAGEAVAQVLRDETVEEPEDERENRALGEARGKKKKYKKRGLHKLFAVAMLMKAKLSLFLQLISTHLQVKFFMIALLNLAINVARFWIDLKKSPPPSKVVYYEHAQHQHHYDHEDDHHWGRSSDVQQPDDIAYSSYAPRE